MKALLIIIAVLFFPASLWYFDLEKMPTIFAAVIAMVVITVIYIIIHYILVYANKRKTKWLLSDKNPEIVSAKKQDEMNQQANQSNCLVALAKKKKEYAPKIKACEAEIQKLEKQQAQLEAEIDAIDELSKKDMHPDTLDFMIERIESRRADSLKEALQQYDAAGRPKSTYYGRDWDLSKGISASDLPKFEDDLCELMEVLAHTDDSYEMAHNWFARHCLLFTQSIVTSDDAVKKSYEVSSRVFKGNLKGNQSWIIKTAGILSACVGTNILASILNGHVVRSEEGKKVLSQCESEKPLTAKEKVVMKNAYIILNRLTSVLYEKFKKKM